MLLEIDKSFFSHELTHTPANIAHIVNVFQWWFNKPLLTSPPGNPHLTVQESATTNPRACDGMLHSLAIQEEFLKNHLRALIRTERYKIARERAAIMKSIILLRGRERVVNLRV